MPEDNYTTFAELAEYARQRALISAKRNGHQEFGYWVRIYRWAKDCAEWNEDCVEEFRGALNALRYRGDYDDPVQDAAQDYARAVHLRKMLINRGERVPRLSLGWLREEAAMLEGQEIEGR